MQSIERGKAPLGAIESMDINEKIGLINSAERKAAGVETPIDRAAAEGYAQALCHAKIITGEKYKQLLDTAKRSYLEHKEKKVKRN